MEITNKQDNGKTIMTVVGRVDTTTAPELDAALQALAGVETLVLDLAGVPYMSSAGLRSLLTAQKKMTASGGSLTIIGVQPVVKEVLDITGFSSILTLG